MSKIMTILYAILKLFNVSAEHLRRKKDEKIGRNKQKEEDLEYANKILQEQRDNDITSYDDMLARVHKRESESNNDLP